MDIIFLAIVIEGIVKGMTSSITLPEKYNEIIKRAISLIIGLLLSFSFGIDYSNILGFEPVYPVAGLIFTGLVAGLGSSVVHDILDKVRN